MSANPSLACRSGILFTPMYAQAVESVLAAERRIYAYPWTRTNFEDALAAGYPSWIMLEREHMLGYAVTMQVIDEMHLLNISVLPEYQRLGLGTRLLMHLCEKAKDRGDQRMILEVRPSNLPGRSFYEHHGFSEIGRRPDYYPAPGGREAALVLEKRL